MPYRDPEKQKIAQRESYLRNKNVYQRRTREGRQKRREFLALYKKKPCMDCGKEYPWYVMDLDHRDDTGKIEKVSSMVARYAWETVLQEIEKCDIVCANCHRIRTWNREQRYKNNHFADVA